MFPVASALFLDEARSLSRVSPFSLSADSPETEREVESRRVRRSASRTSVPCAHWTARFMWAAFQWAIKGRREEDRGESVFGKIVKRSPQSVAVDVPAYSGQDDDSSPPRGSREESSSWNEGKEP